MELKDQVKSITLHWSENSEMNRRMNAVNGIIEKELTLEAFCLACKAASVSAPKAGDGYDKTKYTVNFNNGDSVTMRIDLQQGDYNPKPDIFDYIRLQAC